METVTIPKTEYEQLIRENKTLRNSKLYKRLLQFEKNISKKNLQEKISDFN